jgi:hypothetical protein
MKCEYVGCSENKFEDHDYCILHVDFPPQVNSAEFEKIKELKNKKVDEKKYSNDFNFRGVKLFSVDLNNINTDKDLIFTHSHILNNFECNHAEINGDIWFDEIKIGEHCSFEFSEIGGTVSFFMSQIGGDIRFDKSKIKKYAWFEKFSVYGEASFNHVTIGSSVSFKSARIKENISFYGAQIGGNLWFNNAQIEGEAFFDLLEIKGGLSFKNTHFNDLKGQERAFRSAKIIWERLGDRERADYHFYHEMEAKRKQKSWYLRYPELIAQYPFGYGVHPSRLLFTFLGVLFFFGFIYWIINGTFTSNSLQEKMRFSFLTLIIPAYGVISAQPGILGLLTIVEAFIGAFTWPTFIVTFARKYMR